MTGSRRYLKGFGAAALLVVLAVAGCTPTDGGASVGEDAAAGEVAAEETPGASESPTTTQADDPEPTDDPPSAEPETTEPADPPAAGGDCLVGEWIIPEADMQQFYSSISTQANFRIVGNVGLTFTEDAFEYLPDFVMEMSIAGQEAEGIVGGSVSGSYTSADGVITTSNEDNSMEIAVSVGGQQMGGGGDTADSFLNESPVNSAPYECGPDGPVLMFQNGGADDRIPMALQPAG